MSRERLEKRRLEVARVAARLMVFEGVDQYLPAKRIAARRVLGSEARGARFRPGSLPSNGEIRDAVLALVELAEGRDRSRRLFAMRVVALEHLRALACWDARLIGSVATGHARRGSDIDVHVFGDPDAIELDLWNRGWPFEPEEVTLRTPTGFTTYRHVHLLETVFPVELSLYPRSELRITGRSSTDGKPIDRVPPKRLEAVLARDHPEAWAEWQRTGALDLDGLDDPAPSDEFAGLLRELDRAM